MDLLTQCRQVFRDLPSGCTAAEINVITKDTTIITCRNGKPDTCTASVKNMIFLRASGNATGIVYSENMQADPRELIAMALENAQAVETGAAQPMLENVHDSHCTEKPVLSTDVLMEKAKQLSELPGVASATISLCVRHSVVLNSLGTETEQKQPNYEITLSVPGKGEDNFRAKTCGSRDFDAIDAPQMLAEIANENALACGELPYLQLPSGTYDTVISSDMTVNIMNTAWQLFAQRLIDCGRSPLKVGQQLGSQALSITDYPVYPGSGYDYTIDCEGVRGPARIRLVTDGVVTDTLRTLKQGNSTGSAGRADLFTANINTELISVPRNIRIDAGDFTPAELIQKMGTGIHLTYSMDEFHSLNIANATFSIPCGGVFYENGKPVGRLQQMNLCGSFRELFAGLEASGNDVGMRGMWPHYDYCFGGPSLLIRGAHFAM